MSEPRPAHVHARHFTIEQANASLPTVKPLLQRLRDARDLLTDEEAHAALTEAAPTNGGGEPGTQVGEAFLKVRRLLLTMEEAGIMVRDIDRGLIDFPAVINEREVYLCWELGEDEIAWWHELDAGYRGRQAL